MRKVITVAVTGMTLLAVWLAGCGSQVASPTSNRPEANSTAPGEGDIADKRAGKPPPMRLMVADQTVAAEVGSYCVSGGGKGMCADSAPKPTKALPQVQAASGPATFVFGWRWKAGSALQVSLCAPDSGKCFQETTVRAGQPWRLRLRPGTFRVSAFATWDGDRSGGDAAYDWRLNVAKGPTAPPG